MMESLFKVASSHMKVVQGEDSDLLQTQREDKLRKKEEIKTKQLDKTETAQTQMMIWHERFNTLA